MTDLEQLLVRDLEARADRVPVGPVPLDAVARRAAVRRRRPWVVLGAAAAVVVVAGGLVVALPSNTAPEPRRPTTPMVTPTSAPTQAVRTVGIAHLALEVPASWPTGVSRCTRPSVDAVLRMDRWGTCAGKPLGAGVEVVEPIDVDPRGPDDDGTPSEVEIGGVLAYRSPVFCLASWVPICRGWIWVPSDHAGFVVESRTDAASVNALLDTVRLDAATVTIPGTVPFSGLAFTFGMYRDFAEGLGLSVTIPPGSADQQWIPGSVRVSPPVGTRVPVGTVVRVELRP